MRKANYEFKRELKNLFGCRKAMNASTLRGRMAKRESICHFLNLQMLFPMNFFCRFIFISACPYVRGRMCKKLKIIKKKQKR